MLDESVKIFFFFFFTVFNVRLEHTRKINVNKIALYVLYFIYLQGSRKLYIDNCYIPKKEKQLLGTIKP